MTPINFLNVSLIIIFWPEPLLGKLKQKILYEIMVGVQERFAALDEQISRV